MADKDFHAIPEPSDVKPGNLSSEESSSLVSLLFSLYHTSDIQVRLCWWLFYCLLILCGAVWVAWRMFGSEIAELSITQDGNEVQNGRRHSSSSDEVFQRSDDEASKKTD